MNVCKRCGQAIKHICIFEGENYGADCVQIVSGLSSWEVRASKGDVDTYKERKAARLLEVQKKANEMKAEEKKFSEENDWALVFLKQFENSPFAAAMIEKLTRGSFAELSEGAYDKIREMWSADLKGIEKGYAEAEFIFATGCESLNDKAAVEAAKEFVASFATLKELKELLKNNGVKNYGKLNREQLEKKALSFI